MEAIAGSVRASLWKTAAVKSYNGKGLEAIPDMTPGIQLRHRYFTKGNFDKVAMLDAVMTAKIWPGDRCQEAGYPGESLCPACKLCPGNILHRTYRCQVVQQQLPKRLVKGHLDRMDIDLAAAEPAK